MSAHAVVILELPKKNMFRRLENDNNFGRYLAWRVEQTNSRLWKDSYWRVIGRYSASNEAVTVDCSSGSLKAVSMRNTKSLELESNRTFVLLDILVSTAFRFNEEAGIMLAQVLAEKLTGKNTLQKPCTVPSYGQGMIITAIFESHEEFSLVFSNNDSAFLSSFPIEKSYKAEHKVGVCSVVENNQNIRK